VSAMPIGIQTIIVLAAVAGCVWMIGHQLFRALLGKPSKIGSCCAKGCASQAPKPESGSPLQFIPAESLRRRK